MPHSERQSPEFVFGTLHQLSRSPPCPSPPHITGTEASVSGKEEAEDADLDFQHYGLCAHIQRPRSLPSGICSGLSHGCDRAYARLPRLTTAVYARQSANHQVAVRWSVIACVCLPALHTCTSIPIPVCLSCPLLRPSPLASGTCCGLRRPLLCGKGLPSDKT